MIDAAKLEAVIGELGRCTCGPCVEIRRLRDAPPGELAAFARAAAERLERVTAPRVAALLAGAERAASSAPPTLGDYSWAVVSERLGCTPSAARRAWARREDSTEAEGGQGL